jgi:hypothetical protein
MSRIFVSRLVTAVVQSLGATLKYSSSVASTASYVCGVSGTSQIALPVAFIGSDAIAGTLRSGPASKCPDEQEVEAVLPNVSNLIHWCH